MEEKTLGQKIRTWRKAAGLSQMELGLKCGFDGRSAECSVQHWEHDRREPPLRSLRPLAEALGITLDELIP